MLKLLRENYKAIPFYHLADLVMAILMSVTYGCIFFLGLWLSALITAYDISQSRATPGNFVTQLICLMGMQKPMLQIAFKYNLIQSDIIGAERMLELFNETPETM